MKNWDSQDWIAFILVMTIPLLFTELLIVMAITGKPISEQGLNMIEKVFAAILVALVAIKSTNKKNDHL